MKNEITKKNVLFAIRAMADDFSNGFKYELEDGKIVTEEDIMDYVDKTIAQLDDKAQKAKKNQAEKKAEDTLRSLVKDVITNEPQTIDEIVAKVPATYAEGEKEVEVTKSKVVARLTALVKAGVITKEETKLKSDAGTTRKVMAYSLVPSVDEEVAE